MHTLLPLYLNNSFPSAKGMSLGQLKESSLCYLHILSRLSRMQCYTKCQNHWRVEIYLQIVLYSGSGGGRERDINELHKSLTSYSFRPYYKISKVILPTMFLQGPCGKLWSPLALYKTWADEAWLIQLERGSVEISPSDLHNLALTDKFPTENQLGILSAGKW